MSPAQWKRLASQVADRCARESVPTPEARLVLLALVRARADGRDVPAQEAFARQLGLSYATLRRRLEELGDCGLLVVQAGGRGGAEYDLSEDRLQAWARGVLVFVRGGREAEESAHSEHISGPKSAHSEQINGGKSAHSEHISLARARGLGGGGGEVAGGGDVARAAREDQAVEERVEAAVAVLRQGGVKVPALVKPKVETWVRRGMEPEDFEEAAQEAAENGVQAFRYVERILVRKLADVSNVRSLESYRHREYWPVEASEEG